MKRRIMSTLTALALCLGLCPAWAFTAAGETAGASPVASVTTMDGKTENYTNIREAWKVCLDKSKDDNPDEPTVTVTLTLLEDVDLGGTGLSTEMDSKTDFGIIKFIGNGHTLRSADAYATIRTCRNLTIESGTIINSNNCAIMQHVGTLTLKGGTIKGEGKGAAISIMNNGSDSQALLEMYDGQVIGQNIGVSVTGGFARIRGGEITGKAIYGYGVRGTNVEISGGTISGGTAGVAVLPGDTGKVDVSTLLRPGHFFCDPGSQEPLAVSGSKTQESVVILPHKNHSYGNWQDNGDGTHVRVCACRLEESEEHKYDDNGTCTACGADESKAVARVEFYDGSRRTYTDLREAWNDAVAQKGAHPVKVTLLQSVELDKNLYVEKSGNLTFEMSNGVSLKTGSGPAISIVNGNVTLNNCTITGAGNGVTLMGSGELTVNGGSITGVSGHGIRVEAGNFHTLTLNKAEITGGRNGVYIDTGAPLSAIGCTITGKTGDGVSTNGPITAYGCVFSGENGSGVLTSNALASGDITAEDCTFTGKTGLTLGSKAVLTNCTVNGSSGKGLSVTNGASITISDGSYTGSPALHVDGNPSVKLSGGTFNGGITCTSASLQGLLETKYAYYEGDTIQKLAQAQKELTGNITVKEDPNYQPPTAAALVIAAGDNTVHEYINFTEAWNYANGKTASIQLLKNQEVSSALFLEGGNVTLEMNAGVELKSTISTDAPAAMLNVKSGTLTIRSGILKSTETQGPIAASDSGTVNIDGGELYGHSYAIQLRGSSTLNICGGKISADTDSVSCDGVHVYAENPTVNITGGTFTSAFGVNNASSGNASVRIDGGGFNCTRAAVYQYNANSKLEIYGGTFLTTSSYTTDYALESAGNTTLYGGTFTGGIKAGSGEKLSGLLAEGKRYYTEDGEPFTDTEADKTKTSPLSVRECTHGDTQYQPNDDNATHKVVCTICGQTLLENAAHEQGYTSDGKGNHVVSCKCGQTFSPPSPHTPGEGNGNRCSVCNMLLEAKVEKDSGVIYYDKIGDAWTAAQGSTAKVTLLSSVTTGTTLAVGANTNITLEMRDGVTFTNNNADCFQLSDGTLTLASGTVNEGGSGKSVVYAASGTLRVTGGTYNSSQGNGLWIDKNVTVELSGGTIKASGTTLRYQSPKNVQQMLAQGYVLCGEDGEPVISDDLKVEKLGSGSYTVKPCHHNFDGNGACTICGAKSTITGQPVSAAITYGETATLTVTAQAENSISYQWYWVDTDGNTPIDGANGASYQITDRLPVGTHQFFCAVTSAGVTQDSSPAAVTVTPRPVTASLAGTSSKPYDGTVTCNGEGLSVELADVLDGDEVTASAGSYVYDAPDAGERTITASGITLSGKGKENYKLSNTTAEIAGNISKVKYTGKITASTDGKYGMTKEFNLADLDLPAGYTFGAVSVSDSGGIFNSTPVVNGPKLTYALVNDREKVSKTAEITIPVTAGNYNDFNLTITVRVLDKYAVTLNVPDITITCGQEPQINGTASGGDGTENLPGAWRFEGTVPTDVPGGKVTVVFEPSDTENYQSPVKKEIQLTIRPVPSTRELSAYWQSSDSVLKGELVIEGTLADKWYMVEVKKVDGETPTSVYGVLRGDGTGKLTIPCEYGVTLNLYEMNGTSTEDLNQGYQFVQEGTADGRLTILPGGTADRTDSVPASAPASSPNAGNGGLSVEWRPSSGILHGELLFNGTSADKWYMIEVKKVNEETFVPTSVFITLRGTGTETLVVPCESGVMLNMYEMNGTSMADFEQSYQFVQERTANEELAVD